MANDVLSVEGLKYFYPDHARAALDGASMRVSEGEFALLQGDSGSGKTTLLKCIAGLIPSFYGGRFAGKIVSKDRPSLLFQDPEAQLVMNTVSRELSYPLESAGYSQKEIEDRVTSSSRKMHIEHLLKRGTMTLSSGEKQKVALASLLVTGSKLLLMDEPTSMLDPDSERSFVNSLAGLNASGNTIVVSTHDCAPYERLKARSFFMREGKICIECASELSCDGGKRSITRSAGKCALEMRDVHFAYDNNDVLKGASFDLHEGEMVAITGNNGAGKSTLLRHLNGLERPQKGSILIEGEDTKTRTVAQLSRKVGYLSQNPSDYLFADTVEEELSFSFECARVPREKRASRKAELSSNFGITHMLARYPRDLSAGERQRVALAALLACDQKVIALDEPTRGMDENGKRALEKILALLLAKGHSVIVATHDIPFARANADRVLRLENGRLADANL